MATSFSEIYCLNRLIRNSPTLKKLTPSELNYISYGYLQFAISYFMYDCRKDITNYTAPYNMDYNFTGDGSDTEFVLEPLPPSDVSLEVVIVGEQSNTTVSSSEYSYNPETGIVTFNNAIASGTDITITAYDSGSFSEDLDLREMNILAEGMNVPYLEAFKNDENELRYIVSGNSLRFFSQANHMLASNENVMNQMYKTVDALISDYSYKGSVDEYAGLAKRGSGA